jgi:hypothetical protein
VPKNVVGKIAHQHAALKLIRPPQNGKQSRQFSGAPLQELIALSLLAGFGFGLALARDDLLFAAVFGIASAITIIETIRRR